MELDERGCCDDAWADREMARLVTGRALGARGLHVPRRLRLPRRRPGAARLPGARPGLAGGRRPGHPGGRSTGARARRPGSGWRSSLEAAAGDPLRRRSTWRAWPETRPRSAPSSPGCPTSTSTRPAPSRRWRATRRRPGSSWSPTPTACSSAPTWPGCRARRPEQRALVIGVGPPGPDPRAAAPLLRLDLALLRDPRRRHPRARRSRRRAGATGSALPRDVAHPDLPRTTPGSCSASATWRRREGRAGSGAGAARDAARRWPRRSPSPTASRPALQAGLLHRPCGRAGGAARAERRRQEHAAPARRRAARPLGGRGSGWAGSTPTRPRAGPWPGSARSSPRSRARPGPSPCVKRS